MKRKIGAYLRVLAGIPALLICSCAELPGTPVSTSQMPELRSMNGLRDLTWYTTEGVDFVVYRGRLANVKTAGVGFYRGGFPRDPAGEPGTIEQGKLGVFDVQWYVTNQQKSPKVTKTAWIDYKTTVTKWGRNKEQSYTEKIHIWVYGDSEEEVDAVLTQLNGVALFQIKPADVVRDRRSPS